MLTVYGIETILNRIFLWNIYKIVATVLTVYGIETDRDDLYRSLNVVVATVLTVYGIETS